MTPLKAPPADCPNGEICIEDEVQRRRASDQGVWVRWVLGGIGTVALVILGWSFGRIWNHETRITADESDIAALKATDGLIRNAMKESRDEQQARLVRIEDKLDKLLLERRR